MIQYCNILENFIQRRFRNEIQIGKFCESGEQPVAYCAPTEAVRGWKQPNSRSKATSSRGNGKPSETSSSRRSVEESKVTEQAAKLKPMKSSGRSNRHLNVHPERNKLNKCRYCATRHKFGSRFCPSFGKMCEVCRGSNHDKLVCWYQKAKQQKDSALETHAFKTGSPETVEILETSNSNEVPLNVREIQMTKCDDNPVSEILDFQEEKPIGTISYWSKIHRDIKNDPAADIDIKIDQKMENKKTEDSGQNQSYDADIDVEQNKIEFNPNNVASTHTASENQVNLRSCDEKWLLATIATAKDPNWFESKVVRQNFSRHGGLILKKFNEKYKEIKTAENQKKEERNERFPEKQEDVIHL